MSESTIEKLIIPSECLGKEMSVLVYLPYNYDVAGPFPTLYFHHGRNGDENILLDAGINQVADRLIENQQMGSMIIVCPQLDNSRGLNSSVLYHETEDPSGRVIHTGRYEDYFIREVIPAIDRRFKTIRHRDARFIGGASAGGYIALHGAFRHPELFSKVGGHMPAIELKLEDEDKAYYPDEDTWAQYDPIAIAKNMECTDFNVYLDAGDQDEGRFYEGCAILHKILQDRGIASQNHRFKGHHNIEYIKAHREEYLLFYGNNRIV